MRALQRLMYETRGLVLVLAACLCALHTFAQAPADHPSYTDYLDPQLGAHVCAHTKQQYFQATHKTLGQFAAGGDMFDLIDAELAFTFERLDTNLIRGEAYYTVVMQRQTDTLSLDCGDDLRDFETLTPNVCCPNLERQVLRLQLNSPAEAGDTIRFGLRYTGTPPEQDLSTFVADSFRTGEPIIWTLSQPYGAREWWPTKQSLD
ncbi:MAG: hypothetical protein ACOCZ8_07000, partial [Bacteroidota bacterium]